MLCLSLRGLVRKFKKTQPLTAALWWYGLSNIQWEHHQLPAHGGAAQWPRGMPGKIAALAIGFGNHFLRVVLIKLAEGDMGGRRHSERRLVRSTPPGVVRGSTEGCVRCSNTGAPR